MTGDVEGVVRQWPTGADTAGYWLGYRVGNELFGETSARFEADGRYEVSSTVTADRGLRTFSGRCAPADVAGLAAAVVRERLWDVRHLHPQGDDDSLAVLEVGGGDRHGRIELWVSEIGDVPAFDRVQGELLGLVQHLSGGVILENGH